jgi:hypothetical protein
MSAPQLFLSYKRGPLATPAAERLYHRGLVQLAKWKVFFDQKSIEAGDAWAPAIDQFMAGATHFLAFVSVDYWLSEQCRRELGLALARRDHGPEPRLLFVLADDLSPSDLEVDPSPAVQRIRNLGQINFLGPYDAGGRLVRLRLEDPVALDAQLAALVQRLKAL